MKNLQSRKNQVDRILTRPMFRRDVAAALDIATEISETDLAILLTYLSRDRQILVYDETVSLVGFLKRFTDSPGRSSKSLVPTKCSCQYQKKTGRLCL